VPIKTDTDLQGETEINGREKRVFVEGENLV
jgi:hypothetical protein